MLIKIKYVWGFIKILLLYGFNNLHCQIPPLILMTPSVYVRDVCHWQVSSMELVQEIFQVLIDKEDTCHRTCFTLQLDGITMDNFAELKNIEGLNEGSIIKVVEGG